MGKGGAADQMHSQRLLQASELFMRFFVAGLVGAVVKLPGCCSWEPCECLF